MDRQMKRQFKENLQEALGRLTRMMQRPFTAASTAAALPGPLEEMEKAELERDLEVLRRIQNHYRQMAWEICKTMERIDEDGFGFCEHCGEPIGLKRLQANPTTTTCIDCQRQIELNSRMAGLAAARRGCRLDLE